MGDSVGDSVGIRGDSVVVLGDSRGFGSPCDIVFQAPAVFSAGGKFPFIKLNRALQGAGAASPPAPPFPWCVLLEFYPGSGLGPGGHKIGGSRRKRNPGGAERGASKLKEESRTCLNQTGAGSSFNLRGLSRGGFWGVVSPAVDKRGAFAISLGQCSSQQLVRVERRRLPRAVFL